MTPGRVRGAGLLGGLQALAVAVVTVIAVLVVAIRYGHTISRFMSVKDAEALLLSVPGLTLFVSGVAAELKVSAAVGAFLVGIALPGRLRTGLALMPRGEFSVVIAGPAVASGVEPELAPLATAYVLITVVTGPMLARLTDYAWFKALLRRRTAVRQSAAQSPSGAG